MQRVTITLDDEIMKEVDRMIAERGYQNRSEAIRDLARAGISQAAEESDGGRDCVAALVYVYDQESRELPKRLTKIFRGHHHLSLAAQHVYLDHRSCMEVTVLKGSVHEVQHLASHVMAERGVRYGRLVTIPVTMKNEKHAHGGEPSRRHLHVHVGKAD